MTLTRDWLTEQQLQRRTLHAHVNRELMRITSSPPAEELPEWVAVIAEFVGQKFRKEYPDGVDGLPGTTQSKIINRYYELARELYDQEKGNHAEIS
jgi:hypothetical protein